MNIPFVQNTANTIYFTSASTVQCHWCGIPLGSATVVTYLNGNLPICDLCLMRSKRVI